jgi:hypothetical protein
LIAIVVPLLRTKTVNELTLLLVASVLLSPACKQAPQPSKTLLAGQVRGVLYYPTGARFAEGASVFAGDVIDEGQNGVRIQSDLRYKTNNQGEFTIENVTAGRHALCVFIPPKPDHQTGTSIDPSSITVGIVVNKSNPAYFTMPTAAGIDLGNIEVTSVLSPRP